MIPRIPLDPVASAGYDAVAVTPHRLATVAALTIIDRGGNAVDAAIAANAVQGVVAPETCGIGGDLFALVHSPTVVNSPTATGVDSPTATGVDSPTATGVDSPTAAGPLALNASGRAGSGADADELRRAGLDAIPQRHPAAVTVPGCVDGWIALSRRLGVLDLGTVLEPAIRLGRDGFAAGTELVTAFDRRFEELVDEPAAAPMYPNDDTAAVGERIRRPELARTLETIAETGRNGFYAGDVGAAIAAATDGTVTVEDLAVEQASWVEPLGIDAFGHRGWTVPPNSQGYIALLASAILDRLGPGDIDDPLSWHLGIEAVRAASADRDDVVADPDAMTTPKEALVSERRVEELADRIDPGVAGPTPTGAEASAGTAYLCTVDASGTAVSLIQSNYHGIGSGRSAGEHGFLLHDRGRGFDLRPGHPNELRPGRRPLHTLSPTIWTWQGRVRAVMGTRGGHVQPQLVVQLATNVLGREIAPEQAMAVPRWSFDPTTHHSPVSVEPGLGRGVVSELEARGHDIRELDRPQPGWGPMSVISVADSGLRRGAADPRVDTALAAVR